MGEFKRGWLSGPIKGWLCLFLLVQLFMGAELNTNVASRWSMILAMVEDGTVRIDAYRDRSVDWAKTPDGHYFSNKAPGPALIAYPFYVLIDTVLTAGVEDRASRDAIRWRHASVIQKCLSLLLQALPFLLLSLALFRHFGSSGNAAAILGLVALLLGNSATVFLNLYFGHGMTAVFALLLYYGLLKHRPGLQAFGFGGALLCEYSSALFLIPLLPWWGLQLRAMGSAVTGMAWLRKFSLGALAPAVLWIGYHSYSFGSPLRIANQFQNPLFVEQDPQRWNIGGLFFLPDAGAVFELLLGSSRGLLWTQPWVLFLLVLVFMHPKVRKTIWTGENAPAEAFPLVCFLLLFLMNSSFGAWHGGSTPGPRYLSAGLVLLAASIAPFLFRLSTRVTRTMFVLVGVSVLLQLLFLSVYRSFPPSGVPLWRFYFDYSTGPHALGMWVRLGLSIPFALWLLSWTWKVYFSEAARATTTHSLRE